MDSCPSFLFFVSPLLEPGLYSYSPAAPSCNRQNSRLGNSLVAKPNLALIFTVLFCTSFE